MCIRHLILTKALVFRQLLLITVNSGKGRILRISAKFHQIMDIHGHPDTSNYIQGNYSVAKIFRKDPALSCCDMINRKNTFGEPSTYLNKRDTQGRAAIFKYLGAIFLCVDKVIICI